MSDNTHKTWFPAKTYGWGWGLPTCWQGWLVLLSYCALLIVGMRYLMDRHSDTIVALFVTGLTILLIAICWLKGEKPGWRWGN